MRSISYFLLALCPLTAMAALNGHCSGTATGTAKRQGICVKTSTCASFGGSTINGGCPNDPADVKCCTMYQCFGDESMCQWTNTACDGTWRSGLCPGGSNYKCCDFV
ncbi:predicted protein [Chaetomium globosum CBS 148.51]|uniref:Uncharacterized protein n=1 Tax=Chaetomium globosum (strain ATCC 6205 / CBS 148.51 / DSM 1962 / NBRC 6347 / NRRL 1970) TaxID=306901 RepID=Q2GPS0_CHAGB|nr:uncharacterized protein CHGG_10034 [Chaetomium globosum CBS 148.51]EAQ83630.1 predicted protein [Chaetomium globosum CBS 148.51]